MKTLIINPLVWIKSFLADLTVKDRASSAKYWNAGTDNKQFLNKEEYWGTEKNTKLDINEFQKKAHRGNFFAGPHCIFNPGFF